MRAGLGFLALLMGVGLMVWMFANFEIPKIKAGKEAKKQVTQYAGYGQDDLPAPDSFATAGVMKGSRLGALQVTSVTAGGAMDTFYGLQVGDEITAVGGTPLDAMASGDEELAKSLVVSEGYQRKQPLTVRRSGQSLTLPTGPGSPAARAQPSQASSPAPSPAPPPAPSAPSQPGGLQRQLQGIQDAAGGAQGQD